MSEYRRTQIRRLSVHGYRSLADVELTDLPPVVVLHGQNGTGKSNLLRAIRLALRVMGLPGDLPGERAQARVLSQAEANALLGLRFDDFYRGGDRIIRISLDMSVGERGHRAIGATEVLIDSLSLTVVLENTDDRSLKVWAEEARLNSNETFLLADLKQVAQRAVDLNKLINAAIKEIEQQSQLADQTEGMAHVSALDRIHMVETHMISAQLERDALKTPVLSVPSAERICRAFLARRAVQLSDAERQVHDEPVEKGDDWEATEAPDRDLEVERNVQKFLYLAATSEDVERQEAVTKLARGLSDAGMFGGRAGDRVELRPVRHSVFKEYQVQVRHPEHGVLPLRNLSSGEQQLILMVAQRVLTPWPIAFLEEPEAHLHKALMLTLARFLEQSMVPPEGSVPDVDQLWVSTHHHAFAIAPTYLEVTLDAKGRTQVIQRPREDAFVHFYEPGPFLDALRALMAKGLKDDEVVFRDEEGKQVTAREVRDSLDGDGVVARKFTDFAHQQLVATLHRARAAKVPVRGLRAGVRAWGRGHRGGCSDGRAVQGQGAPDLESLCRRGT